METVHAGVKQRCTPITQHISSVDIGTIWFVGSSETDLSYNYPAQVETLGVEGVVRSVAMFSNLVRLWYVSTQPDKDSCSGIYSWDPVHDLFEVCVVSFDLRRGDIRLVIWEHVTFN